MTATPSASDLAIVRRINVFRGLNPLMLERLIAPAVVLSLREGETVFRQGDPATAFFIVIDGWVKLYRITLAGDEAVIYVFAKGDSFAEAVAFTGQPYPASAETVSEARIVRISAEHVVKCIRAAPEIALAMIASTSQHLHHLVQEVEQLKAQTGVQRVAEFLSGLCSLEDGACTIALPYDKALIAGRLGLKPESLSRAFAKLKPLGVEVRAASVVVNDVAGLRDFASGDRGSTRELLRRAQ
jgi:CRP-like cAMP-binding protein